MILVLGEDETKQHKDIGLENEDADNIDNNNIIEESKEEEHPNENSSNVNLEDIAVKELIESDIGDFEIIEDDKGIKEEIESKKEEKKETKKESKKIEERSECKLSALLDYVFFFYFMALSLVYKELRDKPKFVKQFIEKNKQIIEEIKIRVDRVLANTLPKTYEKLIKFDDYAFILGILMLSINFHIEVQEAIKNQDDKTKKENKKENVKETKNIEISYNKVNKNEELTNKTNITTNEVTYDELW